MKGARNKKRAQADDIKKATKAGTLKRSKVTANKSKAKSRRTPKKKAIDTVMALAVDRYGDDQIAYLQSVHDNGIQPRDLLVLASMEWIDITRDMQSGALRLGEAYRLRTQVLDTLRKLAEHEAGGDSVPNLIQINVGADDFDRQADPGKPLELGG